MESLEKPTGRDAREDEPQIETAELLGKAFQYAFPEADIIETPGQTTIAKPGSESSG